VPDVPLDGPIPDDPPFELPPLEDAPPEPVLEPSADTEPSGSLLPPPAPVLPVELSDPQPTVVAAITIKARLVPPTRSPPRSIRH
jgi:hypothetical protein